MRCCSSPGCPAFSAGSRCHRGCICCRTRWMLGASGFMVLVVSSSPTRSPASTASGTSSTRACAFPPAQRWRRRSSASTASTWAAAAAVLGGSLAATSHLAKATTRAAVNTSPEPFSNWSLSLLGDVSVPASCGSRATHPLLRARGHRRGRAFDAGDHRRAVPVPARLWARLRGAGTVAAARDLNPRAYPLKPRSMPNVQEDPDRQSWRDRLPRGGHGAAPGRAHRRRLLRCGCRRASTCWPATRRCASAGARRSESYLRGSASSRRALATGAEAVHPGYGFLSENEGFAQACAAGRAGVHRPAGRSAIAAMGCKSARQAADGAGGRAAGSRLPRRRPGPGAAAPRGRAHRLSGADQGQRRRRRQGHAHRRR